MISFCTCSGVATFQPACLCRTEDYSCFGVSLSCKREGGHLQQSLRKNTFPFFLSSSDPQSNKALALQSRLHLYHPGGLHGDRGGGRLRRLPGKVPGAAVQPHHLICQPAPGWVIMGATKVPGSNGRFFICFLLLLVPKQTQRFAYDRRSLSSTQLRYLPVDLRWSPATSRQVGSWQWSVKNWDIMKWVGLNIKIRSLQAALLTVVFFIGLIDIFWFSKRNNPLQSVLHLTV